MATNQHILRQVQESMMVYDREGGQVGRVDYVHFGADKYASEWNFFPETESEPEDIFGVMPEERVPEEMRERLLQTGFVKINTGLLATDRYILPEQIESVSSDSVHLNVHEEDTLKF